MEKQEQDECSSPMLGHVLARAQQCLPPENRKDPDTTGWQGEDTLQVTAPSPSTVPSF